MERMGSILWIPAVILAGYFLLVGLIYLFQSSMVYYPSGHIFGTPSAVGLEYEEVTFTSSDGVSLSGWYVPAENARLTVLFQHGNAGNISGRLGTIQQLHRQNLNVFIYDFRGYGRSGGTPTEQGTYLDALAAWNYLVEKRGTPPGKIVIMGRSLGGAIGAWLAARRNPAGLILESTFTSAPDLASELYPFLPVRWLIKFRYDTITYLQDKDTSVPVLVVHSREDELVPFNHGRKLYESLSEPKEFVALRGGHGGAHIESEEVYLEGLGNFINQLSNQ